MVLFLTLVEKAGLLKRTCCMKPLRLAQVNLQEGEVLALGILSRLISQQLIKTKPNQTKNFYSLTVEASQ